MSKREKLIARAAELKIEHAGNISNANLEGLIAAAEAEQNTKAGASDGANAGGGGATPTDAEAGGADTAALLQPSGTDDHAGGSDFATTIAQSAVRLNDALQSAAAGTTPPPPADTSKTHPTDTGMVVIVTGPKKGRWRAGMHFTSEPRRIPVDDLTEAQKAQLAGDPLLTLQHVEA